MEKDVIDAVVLANDRDRRVLDWLRSVVGDAAILAALQGLAGGRRPYVSNLCKVLGVSPPKTLALTPMADARQRLSDLKRLLDHTKH